MRKDFNSVYIRYGEKNSRNYYFERRTERERGRKREREREASSFYISNVKY